MNINDTSTPTSISTSTLVGKALQKQLWTIPSLEISPFNLLELLIQIDDKSSLLEQAHLINCKR